jgi:hypothetical protein
MDNPLVELRMLLSGFKDFSYLETDLCVFLCRPEGLVDLLLAISQAA